MPEQPIFEIISGQKHIKIFADGQVSGMREEFVIINRIPATMDAAVAGIKIGQEAGRGINDQRN